MEYSFQLSRNLKALKIWIPFKAYGADKLRDAIQENIATMRHLANLIDEATDFERLAPVPLSAVCFRYWTEDLQYHHNDSYLSSLNTDILRAVGKDGRVYITGTTIQGKTAPRACCTNHRTRPSDVEYLMTVLRELESRIHKSRKKTRIASAASYTSLAAHFHIECNNPSIY